MSPTRRQSSTSARPTAAEREDLVFKALAHPHRRRILDLLRKRARTTGELAAEFDESRFATMKHLRLLEDAKLVVVKRRGRERWNLLNPAPIRSIYRRWIRPFEEQSADWLLRIKDFVEE